MIRPVAFRMNEQTAVNNYYQKVLDNLSPKDANKKAQEEGASSYRIIEARTGDHWHATAELYK